MPTGSIEFRCDVAIRVAPTHRDSTTDSQLTSPPSLVDDLKALLVRKLGLRASILVEDTEDISSQSPQSESEANVLVVILSDGYLRSESCLVRLNRFLAALSGHPSADGRVFVALTSDIPRDRWPEGIKRLLAYEFFKRDGTESPSADRGQVGLEYSTALDDLTTDIASSVRRLADDSDQGSMQPRVLLAEHSEDVEKYRGNIRRHLLQAGVRVLPEYWYGSGFKQATLADLDNTDVFVQLFGPHDPRQSAAGINAQIQYELAEEQGIYTLRWRAPEVDLDNADSKYRTLLERGNVIASGLEDFKEKIVERAHAIAARPRDGRAGPFVLVNADEVDRPLAGQVGSVLQTHGLNYDISAGKDVLVDRAGGALLGGLLIVYGECSPVWVKQRLWSYRKAMARSETRPPVCAVYDGPPTDKHTLQYSLPSMQVIDCRESLDESALRPFIEAVHGKYA